MTKDRAHRGRGRPSIGDGVSTPVNVRMTAPAYDATYARAVAERRTVPALVRAAVARYLADRDDDADRAD